MVGNCKEDSFGSQQGFSTIAAVAAWGLPAAHTIAVLVTRDVDADELTGRFCWIHFEAIQNPMEVLIKNHAFRGALELSVYLPLFLSLTHFVARSRTLILNMTDSEQFLGLRPILGWISDIRTRIWSASKKNARRVLQPRLVIPFVL